MKMVFDKESHMKSKFVEESELKSTSTDDSDSPDSIHESDSRSHKITRTNRYNNFRRKFSNPDFATCWLNSCLQLILTALDRFDCPSFLESELGAELIRLRDSNKEISLDPTNVKNIVVAAEDTRIAVRISELEAEIQNKAQLEHQIERVRRLRYDLLHGQQYIKDFFPCLQEKPFPSSLDNML